MKYRALFLLLSVSLISGFVAAQGFGNNCDLSGNWYGGSVVAYRMSITAINPAGHYTVHTEGMYKNAVMNTSYDGTLVKNGKIYEGTMISLTTQDPAYLNPPPFANLPDIIAGYFTIEMVDCNTIQSKIPFLGLYFGAGVWSPGTPWTGINWVQAGKIPLVNKPDVDLVIGLTGNTKPIFETYHRLLPTVNPELLHH